MGEPDAAAIESWIIAVERELAQVDSQLAPLVERQAGLNERLGLLRRLLGSLSTVTSQEAAVRMPAPAASAARVLTTVRERVQAEATSILRDAGGPLHINQIHAEFIRRGFQVPGAGKPNNITVHLANAPDLRSTARGVYELVNTDNGLLAIRYPVVDRSKAKQARG